MLRKLFLISLLLLLTGCAGEAPYEDVDKATALFFQRLDAEQYDDIYNDASEYYKDSNPRVAVLESLKQMKALGNHATPSRAQMIFDTHEGKRIAEPVYAVLFEKARTLVTIRYIDEGGEWKLMGFMVKQRMGG